MEIPFQPAKRTITGDREGEVAIALSPIVFKHPKLVCEDRLRASFPNSGDYPANGPVKARRKASCSLVYRKVTMVTRRKVIFNEKVTFIKVELEDVNLKKTEKKTVKKTIRAREARLTIDCYLAEKRKIKILAASQDMSITDFMLSLVEEKYSPCPLGRAHFPNKETIASIKGSEKGKGLHIFDSPGPCRISR